MSGSAVVTANAPEETTDVEPLLRLSGITKRFGGVTALSDVAMDLRPGMVRGLIGPNGAGKTTLFDVISGVTPPTEGSVLFDGRDITRLSPTGRARQGIRRTFQRVQVFSWLSVEDNVLAALEWHGGGGGVLADLVALPTRRRLEAQRRERVAEVLAWCGLEAVRTTTAGSLPLGIQRLVELARAIADRPRLLLLDEPTSGLDHAESTRFGELIDSLRGEGCAVLLVEHDAEFVMRLCDQITVLNLGSVLAEGSPAEIRANQAVRDAYLG